MICEFLKRIYKYFLPSGKGMTSSLSSTAVRSNMVRSLAQTAWLVTSGPSSSHSNSDTIAMEKCLLIPAGLCEISAWEIKQCHAANQSASPPPGRVQVLSWWSRCSTALAAPRPPLPCQSSSCDHSSAIVLFAILSLCLFRPPGFCVWGYCMRTTTGRFWESIVFSVCFITVF